MRKKLMMMMIEGRVRFTHQVGLRYGVYTIQRTWRMKRMWRPSYQMYAIAIGLCELVHCMLSYSDDWTSLFSL